MMDLHEARFHQPLPGKKVLRTLCPHDCRIPENGRGACSVRYNRGAKLYTLVYDKVVAREVNPIEKKPLFHFYPGSWEDGREQAWDGVQLVAEHMPGIAAINRQGVVKITT